MEVTQQDRGTQTRAISDGAVQLLRDYTGRGPTKARTIFSEDMVTIVLADTLTKGERKLVGLGGEGGCSIPARSSSGRCGTTWLRWSRARCSER